MRASKILGIAMLVLTHMSCDRAKSDPSTIAAAAPNGANGRGATSKLATTQTASQDQAMEDKLMGTWVAKDVDAKLGEVKIKLTFRKEGPMKLAAWSDIPFAGQVRDKTAPYEVHGDVISSDAIRGGTSVTYWFEGAQLIIRYKEGKTVRFDRQ